MCKRLLVIDDDASFREVMKFSMEEEGYDVITAEDGEEGLEVFKADPFPVVVTDLRMPGLDGLSLLDKVLKMVPETLVIVITAFGDMETAVKAMKAGAFDFLPKPCDRDHFKLTVRRATEHARLRVEVRELKGQAGSEGKTLIFHSRAMEKLVELTDRVAASDATIIIEGESGTGKELLARRIHRSSPQKDHAFVAVNCGAVPKDLLEDELFGHVRGAFTGADSNRKGRFLQADGGTIFLDEIGELPTELQTRLLRVLQERVIDVVGKDEPVPVNVRVIAATNKNLQKAVKENTFRQDLFFRLNVVPLTIPPLRERPEDIVPLAKYFLKRHSRGLKWSISTTAAYQLETRAWPGNVRELENLCHRVTLLSDEPNLREKHLPGKAAETSVTRISPVSISLPKEGISLVKLEQGIIEACFDHNQRQLFSLLTRIMRHHPSAQYRISRSGTVIHAWQFEGTWLFWSGCNRSSLKQFQ